MFFPYFGNIITVRHEKTLNNILVDDVNMILKSNFDHNRLNLNSHEHCTEIAKYVNK